MTHLTWITVGPLREKHLAEVLAEYEKMLSRFARVEKVTVREERIRDEADGTEVRRALAAEGERILRALPAGALRVALCVEGRQLTSEEFAAVIGEAADNTGKIAFVIGSSHGLAEEVKAGCDLRLSFSRMTFPHTLMQVILAEQVYRAFTILAGKTYHK